MHFFRRAAACTCAMVASLLLLSNAVALHGQAALLMEQPYGVFGTLNPTGHAAIFLERVCADSPTHLRECLPGETGVVISRYKGMDGYDWVAIPLIPYLYAVETASEVPAHVDVQTVTRLRNHYREARLGAFGEALPPGGFTNGGWTELVGTAYDRRTYAFRFDTTIEQDRRLIARMNALPNRSHFHLLFNNCADFDRFVLKNYFPRQFGRTVFPDAGITTPKHVAYSLVKYGKHHPEVNLTVLEIPQVPGFRHESRNIHGITESLIANGYVVPIVVLNPYVAGGLFADYLLRGRYHLVPKNPGIVNAEHLEALTHGNGAALTATSPRSDNPADTTRVQGTAIDDPTVVPAMLVPSADHE